MKKYRKPIQGNRSEIIVIHGIFEDVFQLWDKTLQVLIADSSDANELILYAEHNNMLNPDAVIIS